MTAHKSETIYRTCEQVIQEDLQILNKVGSRKNNSQELGKELNHHLQKKVNSESSASSKYMGQSELLDSRSTINLVSIYQPDQIVADHNLSTISNSTPIDSHTVEYLNGATESLAIDSHFYIFILALGMIVWHSTLRKS